MTVELDWENLGFSYRKLPFRYISYYKDGKWDDGQLTEDATLHLSESSPALHYGQQAFEGLKAYRTKDGSIQLFRPDKNAERLQRTADRLLMPQNSLMLLSRSFEQMKSLFRLMAQGRPFIYVHC